ncbi:hypothetical protein [Sulfitobacter sp. R18_1]|uniref:hypothetical protein n=1 Tax=Sulfitobacter sp. R18_1 TaxID=2821104 RepID=UPI001ADBB9B7|nr:hypothetical protein [Sulfitobacter sp. R18_1]MBO9428810.1 hypothetical protein [Sulfitobacter sp. R18_1]
MNINKLQGTLGKGRLQKFYNKSSKGFSSNLRSAVIGMTIGMSTFAVSGVSVQHPISTNLIDAQGNVRGKLNVEEQKAELEFDGVVIEDDDNILLRILYQTTSEPYPILHREISAPTINAKDTIKLDLGVALDGVFEGCNAHNTFLFDECLQTEAAPVVETINPHIDRSGTESFYKPAEQNWDKPEHESPVFAF